MALTRSESEMMRMSSELDHVPTGMAFLLEREMVILKYGNDDGWNHFYAPRPARYRYLEYGTAWPMKMPIFNILDKRKETTHGLMVRSDEVDMWKHVVLRKDTKYMAPLVVAIRMAITLGVYIYMCNECSKDALSGAAWYWNKKSKRFMPTWDSTFTSGHTPREFAIFLSNASPMEGKAFVSINRTKARRVDTCLC